MEYKSKYGTTEPTDIMVDMLLQDFKSSGRNRIIAIGGGAVIDMAKILMLKKTAIAKEISKRNTHKKAISTYSNTHHLRCRQ